MPVHFVDPATAATGNATALSPLGLISLHACPSGITALTLLEPGLATDAAGQPLARQQVFTTSRATGQWQLQQLNSQDEPTRQLLQQASSQLAAYFQGELQQFDLPLAPAGTAFQRQVWQQLCQIPYGATQSYGALASTLGKPAAMRAVGAANGRNPIAIIVPCHRVIAADGRLTGYAGGLSHKVWLLQLEAADHYSVKSKGNW